MTLIIGDLRHRVEPLTKERPLPMNLIHTTLAAWFAATVMLGQVTTTMTVAGTSNLHDWESAVTKANVKMVVAHNGDGVRIQSLSVLVPVKGIVSDHELMDRKTYEAFEEPKFPTITLTSAQVVLSDGKATIKGQLSMHGVTKPVVLNATYSTTPHELVLHGTHRIDMTEFGMVPPTAVMGSIKVGKSVTIAYKVKYPL